MSMRSLAVQLEKLYYSSATRSVIDWGSLRIEPWDRGDAGMFTGIGERSFLSVRGDHQALLLLA